MAYGKDLYHRYNEAKAERVGFSPNPELLLEIGVSFERRLM
jgi:hypothetical protein